MPVAYNVKNTLIQQYTRDLASWQKLAASMIQPALTRQAFYWASVLVPNQTPPKPTTFMDFYFEAWVSPHTMAVESYQELLQKVIQYEVQEFLLKLSVSNPLKALQVLDLQNLVQTQGGALLMDDDMLTNLPSVAGSFPSHYKCGLRGVSTGGNFPSGVVLEFRDVGHAYFDSLDISVLNTMPQGAGVAACLRAHLKWALTGTFDIQQYQVGTRVSRDPDEEEEPSTTPDADLEDQKKQWVKDGCCPQCGECGRLDPCGGAECSKHGFYQMELS